MSKQKLLEAWNQSRDSSSKPAAPGSDGVRAKSFAANLDENLTVLAGQIKSQNFRFSKLRAKPIAREGGKSDRIICIPTVRDRLVQKAISRHIYARKLLPIFHDASFGFIPGTSAKEAIKRCLDLRVQYDFVFETDISSFFDTIDRAALKKKIDAQLGRSSLVPLIRNAINLEIGYNQTETENKIRASGIISGQGLRQGMPLSPVLANFVLSDFDSKIQVSGYKMVRYADDIVVFADSLNSAKECQNLIINELGKINHTIPDISELGKTRIAGRHQEFSFLGRSIVFSESAGRYVQKISKAKISKIIQNLKSESDLESLISHGTNFPQFSSNISRRVSSYVYAYSDAFNAAHFENELTKAYGEIMRQIVGAIFGPDAVRNASKKHLSFLGIAPAIGVYDDFDIVDHT